MIKNIIFDFDGVILDSLPIKEFGFREIFKEFDKNLVNKLISYHNKNGGLSRYIKIKYFYEKILNQQITEQKISRIANKFSAIMVKELIKEKYLIKQTVDFIKQSQLKYNFHIASGSDEKELQFICKSLHINHFFQSLNGSPAAKEILIEKILYNYSYKKDETIFIGDSFSDYEAASKNIMDFYGFNNEDLKKYSKQYIYNFNTLRLK